MLTPSLHRQCLAPLRSVFYGLVLLSATATANDDLLENLFEPVEGAISPLIDTSGNRAAILQQLSVVEGAYVIETRGYEENDAAIFATASLPQVEPGQKYLLSIEFNVEEMELFTPSDARKIPPAGLRIYFHQTHGAAHRWAAISGRGASNGWIKVSIPIDTSTTAELAKGYILITLSQVEARVHLRNFKLHAVGDELPETPVFLLPDGRETLGPVHLL